MRKFFKKKLQEETHLTITVENDRRKLQRKSHIEDLYLITMDINKLFYTKIVVVKNREILIQVIKNK